MEWIWKQILLPRLTYGCHVWGHSLTQYHKSIIKTVKRLALVYYAPMWKTTPTASLQVILNQKTSHIEVRGVGIRSYICIKKQFQNNIWDGIPNNKRANSHLATLKSITHNIIHEGIPLDNFESDYLREPSFSWNPPICNTLMAVGKDDIDNQFDFDDNKTMSQTDTDDNSFGEADSHTGDVTMAPVEDFLQVNGEDPRHDDDDTPTDNVTITPAKEFLQVNGDRLQHDTDNDVTMKPVKDFLQVNSDDAAMTPVEEFLQGDGNPHKAAI